MAVEATIYEVRDKRYPVSATKTTAIAKGDLTWFDASAGVLKSATDFPWQGSLAQTQRQFARVFAGIAREASPAGTNTPAGTFLSQDTVLVSKGGGAVAGCASATLAPGTLLAPARVGVTDFIDPQNVAVVTDMGMAIGRALGRYGASKTQVEFEFWSIVDVPETLGLRPSYVADPGTGVAIPVDRGMFAIVELDIADAAQTNTVANAGWVGQQLLISCKTRAGTGSRAITFANAFNATPHTIMTFDAVGETALFISGADLKWTLVVAKGATGS